MNNDQCNTEGVKRALIAELAIAISKEYVNHGVSPSPAFKASARILASSCREEQAQLELSSSHDALDRIL